MWRRLTLVALVLTLVGCGHSEDEWQAQLAKYDALAQKNAATEAELEQARQRVTELEAQLEEMGLKVKDMDSMRAALEDYKKRAETLERIKARFEALRKKLEKLTNLGLKVEIRRNRMVISLPGEHTKQSIRCGGF